MDVPVLQLLLLFGLALAALVLLIFILVRAFLGHKRGLGYALAAVFLVAWVVHLFTGWQEFAAEQAAHGAVATVFGAEGYVWTWLASSFENIMSEFLQLAAFVVLTALLVFEGSAESKDSDDRLEASIAAIHSKLDALQQSPRAVRSAPPSASPSPARRTVRPRRAKSAHVLRVLRLRREDAWHGLRDLR